MARAVLFCSIIALALAPVANAQLAAGTWELSVSGTAGSVSQTYSSSSSGGSRTTDAEGYLTLYLRPAVFLTEGLSFEPEIVWTAIENDPPAFNLAGNLSYTYRAPEAVAGPFVLIGYGVGNTVPLTQRALGRMSDKMDISVLNVGGGVKFFLGERIALRTEYRYQRYGYAYDYPNFTYINGSFVYQTVTREIVWNFHSFIIGVSVFL